LENRNFTKKRDSKTNLKDVQNADKQRKDRETIIINY